MGGLEMRTIHQSAAARLLYQAPPARAVIAAEYLGLQAVDSWAAGGAGTGGLGLQAVQAQATQLQSRALHTSSATATEA